MLGHVCCASSSSGSSKLHTYLSLLVHSYIQHVMACRFIMMFRYFIELLNLLFDLSIGLDELRIDVSKIFR